MIRIKTKDAEGNVNGWLLPLWNSATDNWVPRQVYLTVVAPGKTKGPHLHMKRSGRFICVRGNVEIRLRDEQGRRWNEQSGEAYDYRWVQVPAGHAAALYNHGTEEAFVLNFPDVPWTQRDPDDWPVENWQE